MNRSKPWTAILIGLALPASALSATGAERPNILLILSDDHAAHAVSAYGSGINRTPNIDRLARDGALFRNCFAVNSICAPSRASILTGTYGHVNGVTTNAGRLRPDLATFPELLREAGYTTALVGKWHLKDPAEGDRIVLDRDRWYCLEHMIRANDVGQANGELAAWIDGKLYIHYKGIRWRTGADVKLKRFNIGVYVHRAKKDNTVWYDDVVLSTGYIGPEAE